MRKKDRKMKTDMNATYINVIFLLFGPHSSVYFILWLQVLGFKSRCGRKLQRNRESVNRILLKLSLIVLCFEYLRAFLIAVTVLSTRLAFPFLTFSIPPLWNSAQGLLFQFIMRIKLKQPKIF